ncbi:hypothetical protein [Nocardioides sp. SLBN-35]|uniref:hypothetical protein n=1 Tax=Nocardioides sp. SLBN-35 TaxID=2768445 RepID=UPI00114DA1A4|nr:hypothetical protein [Nocardioides sp. SLBN-35]TQK71166.1 hypothetical protein FBY23_2954 [Nocardioides sp. SLBN-35]
MSWTWARLHAAVTTLELPADEYVVGLAGAMLANESVDNTAEVVLLATDDLNGALLREGWPRRTADDGLACPGEPGLVVRAGEVSDVYLAPIVDLITDAWVQDDVRVVSMLQLDRHAVAAFLAASSTADQPLPGRSTWTWRRLSDALRALELPHDGYVVGLNGALLANESLAEVDQVEVLVTDALHDELVRRGWPTSTDVLLCPTQDDLSARSGDVSDTYLLDVTGLVADAWTQDGIALVSMVRVRPEAVQGVLRPGR